MHLGSDVTWKYICTSRFASRPNRIRFRTEPPSEPEIVRGL